MFQKCFAVTAPSVSKVFLLEAPSGEGKDMAASTCSVQGLVPAGSRYTKIFNAHHPWKADVVSVCLGISLRNSVLLFYYHSLLPFSISMCIRFSFKDMLIFKTHIKKAAFLT